MNLRNGAIEMFEVGDLVEPNPKAWSIDHYWLVQAGVQDFGWPAIVRETSIADGSQRLFFNEGAAGLNAVCFRKVEVPASNCSQQVCPDHNDYPQLADKTPDAVQLTEENTAWQSRYLGDLHEVEVKLEEAQELQQATMADCERLSSTVDALTAERDTGLEAYRSLNQRYAGICGRAAGLEFHLKEKTSELVAEKEHSEYLRGVVASREEMIDALSKESSKDVARIEQLEAELDSRSAESAEFERRWEHEQERASALSVQNEELKGRLDAVNEEVLILVNCNEKARIISDRLSVKARGYLDERNQLRDELGIVREALTAAEDMVSDLQSNLAGRRHEITDLRSRVMAGDEAYVNTSEELQMANAYVEDLKKEIADKNVHIGQLTQRLLEVSGDGRPFETTVGQFDSETMEFWESLDEWNSATLSHHPDVPLMARMKPGFDDVVDATIEESVVHKVAFLTENSESSDPYPIFLNCMTDNSVRWSES